MPQFVTTVKPDNVAQHIDDYTASLGGLSRTVDFADVTFHFRQGVKIKTNKLMLAKASKLFSQLFEVNCVSCASTSVSYDVICPDISPETVEVLLELLHQGSSDLKTKDQGTVDSLVQVLEIFQLDSVRMGLNVTQTSVLNRSQDDRTGPESSRTSTSASDGNAAEHQDPRPTGPLLKPEILTKAEADAELFGRGDAGRSRHPRAGVLHEPSKAEASSGLRKRKRRQVHGGPFKKRPRPDVDNRREQASEDDPLTKASSDSTITIVHHGIKLEPLDQPTGAADPEAHQLLPSVNVCHICLKPLEQGEYCEAHMAGQHQELSPDSDGQQQQFEELSTVKNESEAEDRETTEVDLALDVWNGQDNIDAPDGVLMDVKDDTNVDDDVNDDADDNIVKKSCSSSEDNSARSNGTPKIHRKLGRPKKVKVEDGTGNNCHEKSDKLQSRCDAQAALKASKNAIFEKPILAGCTNLLRPEMEEMVDAAIASGRFNDPKKMADHTIGNIYIYRAGDKAAVAKVDGCKWVPNACYSIVPKGSHRLFTTSSYKHLDVDTVRKIVYSELESAVQVVHYRGALRNKTHQRRPLATQTKQEQLDQFTSDLEETFRKVSSQPPKLAHQPARQVARPSLENQMKPLDRGAVTALMDNARDRGCHVNDGEVSRIRLPTGGQVYLFRVPYAKETCTKSLCQDGYPWRRAGKDSTKAGMTKVARTYRKKDSEQSGCDFRKFIYYRASDDMALVHYLGDASKAAHKRGRLTSKEWSARLFNLQRKICEIDPRLEKSADEIYQEMLKQVSGPGQDLARPDDLRQVRKILEKMKREEA